MMDAMVASNLEEHDVHETRFIYYSDHMHYSSGLRAAVHNGHHDIVVLLERRSLHRR